MRASFSILRLRLGVTVTECSAIFARSRLLVQDHLGVGTYSSLPASLNSPDFAAIAARTSSVIFIEQNFGPHIEQKWATLAPSAGRVSSWAQGAVIGASGKLN